MQKISAKVDENYNESEKKKEIAEMKILQAAC